MFTYLVFISQYYRFFSSFDVCTPQLFIVGAEHTNTFAISSCSLSNHLDSYKHSHDFKDPNVVLAQPEIDSGMHTIMVFVLSDNTQVVLCLPRCIFLANIL